jgi:hypothetical protein
MIYNDFEEDHKKMLKEQKYKLFCPSLWTDQKWQCDMRGAWGDLPESCPKWKTKMECWKLYEKRLNEIKTNFEKTLTQAINEFREEYVANNPSADKDEISDFVVRVFPKAFREGIQKQSFKENSGEK